jgi:hypothetical protein
MIKFYLLVFFVFWKKINLEKKKKKFLTYKLIKILQNI